MGTPASARECLQGRRPRLRRAERRVGPVARADLGARGAARWKERERVAQGLAGPHDRGATPGARETWRKEAQGFEGTGVREDWRRSGLHAGPIAHGGVQGNRAAGHVPLRAVRARNVRRRRRSPGIGRRQVRRGHAAGLGGVGRPMSSSPEEGRLCPCRLPSPCPRARQPIITRRGRRSRPNHGIVVPADRTLRCSPGLAGVATVVPGLEVGMKRPARPASPTRSVARADGAGFRSCVTRLDYFVQWQLEGRNRAFQKSYS